MHTLFNSEGAILVRDVNGNYNYCPAILGPPDDKKSEIQIENSDHYINWVIGVDPNATRVYDRSSREAIEYQIACTQSYPEGFFYIAPGFQGSGLRGYSLKSQEARNYIEKKYGQWGLDRLKKCLISGDRF